jgi:hypothetical protein
VGGKVRRKKNKFVARHKQYVTTLAQKKRQEQELSQVQMPTFGTQAGTCASDRF